MFERLKNRLGRGRRKDAEIEAEKKRHHDPWDGSYTP
ncbi:MAG: hypothetical protein JWP13_472 [Candidatus Saccharibacteria bacterium]|nr:hypothetical protein [Candidatus Saccharibacteria bacterium]